MPHKISHLSRPSVGAFAVLLIAALLSGCGLIEDHQLPSDHRGGPGGTAPSVSGTVATSVETRVLRVIDGDTIAVEAIEGVLPATSDTGHEHAVRLLGIDAPEMNVGKDAPPECGAPEAAGHLAELLPEDGSVVVTYDPASDRTDKYGRSLAYLAGTDHGDVGLAQVASGYATPWYPAGEPEPIKTGQYRLADERAGSLRLGAHAGCEAVGRG